MTEWQSWKAAVARGDEDAAWRLTERRMRRSARRETFLLAIVLLAVVVWWLIHR
jgi:hypothetical protein